MTGKIVLGVAYGDEGKGITTDYLCSKASNPIVVRFSGGQQVGHTVEHNGYKHIHSNFGSGTLRGIPTYYSEHTSIYPTTFGRELSVLKENGIEPVVIIHPMAMITTPWDVIANRRDDENMGHGSCGLGIGKTQKRQESPYKLYAIDLLNPEILQEKLDNIENHFYDYLGPCEGDELHEVAEFHEYVRDNNWLIKGYEFLTNYRDIIFEGSQGILLDKDFGVFPNVTHANTTSKNAHAIMDKLGISRRSVYYVTRCYSTRHGAGTFVEAPIELINNEDETNVFNVFQKEFKVAPLDYEAIKRGLRYDDIFSHDAEKHLVVTCLDQLPDFKLEMTKIGGEFESVHESWSPDSKDFKMVYTA